MIFCLLLQNLSVVLACMCHIEYYLLTVRSHFLDIPPSFCVLWCRGGCSLWTLSALHWFVVLPALLFYPTYMSELNLWRGGRRHLGWEKKTFKRPKNGRIPESSAWCNHCSPLFCCLSFVVSFFFADAVLWGSVTLSWCSPVVSRTHLWSR